MINNNNTIKHQKTQTTFFIPILATHKRKRTESLQIFILQFRQYNFESNSTLQTHTPHPQPPAFTKSNDDSSRNQTKNWKICKERWPKAMQKPKKELEDLQKSDDQKLCEVPDS
jgi:hypothetical protein